MGRASSGFMGARRGKGRRRISKYIGHVMNRARESGRADGPPLEMGSSERAPRIRCRLSQGLRARAVSCSSLPRQGQLSLAPSRHPVNVHGVRRRSGVTCWSGEEGARFIRRPPSLQCFLSPALSHPQPHRMLWTTQREWAVQDGRPGPFRRRGNKARARFSGEAHHVSPLRPKPSPAGPAEAPRTQPRGPPAALRAVPHTLRSQACGMLRAHGACPVQRPSPRVAQPSALT